MNCSYLFQLCRKSAVPGKVAISNVNGSRCSRRLRVQRAPSASWLSTPTTSARN